MKKIKGFQIISALLLSGAILFASIDFALIFKPLYYFDVGYLHVDKTAHMDANEIKKNYSILINYINSTKIKKLDLPSFKLTSNTMIHFNEVKSIFTIIRYMMYIFGILGVICAAYNIKRKSVFFLKYAVILLLSVPIITFPLALSFSGSFTAFHKILFRNEFWLIDPEKDPIINIFPEPFFFHCMIVILIILLLSCISLYFIYKKLIKRYDNIYL